MSGVEQKRDNVRQLSAGASDSDRRVRKSTAAIRAAFNKLFLEKAWDEFAVADIIERADVARSTFYQHFSSREGVLCAVVTPMLTPIATCTVSAGMPPHLPHILEHIWKNRKFARALFQEPAHSAITRLIADLIEAQRPTANIPVALPPRLAAMSLATSAFGMLEEWLTGRHKCSPDLFAHALHANLFAAASALANVAEPKIASD